jgi:hypothetical protein
MAKLPILPDKFDVFLKLIHHMTNPNFKIMKCGNKYYLKFTFIFNQSLVTVFFQFRLSIPMNFFPVVYDLLLLSLLL